MTLYLVICFFLDLTGEGHFEVSKSAYVTEAACSDFADRYAVEKSLDPDVGEVWTICAPIPGSTT